MDNKLISVHKIEDPEDRDLALLELLRGSSGERSVQELEEIVNHIGGAYEKTEACVALYEIIRDTDLDESIKYLETASDFAVQADEVWQRGELLSKIGVLFVKEGKLDKAKEIFELGAQIAAEGQNSPSIQDSLDCSSTVAEIAINFSKAGMPEEASKVIATITNEYVRDRTIRFLTDDKVLKYGGMTVNERLWHAGLMKEFDAAVGRLDGKRLIEILKEVELDNKTIEAILAKYGINSPETYKEES
jgi:hypothetical protein